MREARRPRSRAPVPQYPPLAGVVGLLLGAGVAASCGGNPGGYERRGPDGTRLYYDESHSPSWGTGGGLGDAGAAGSGAAGAPDADAGSSAGGAAKGDGQGGAAGAPRSP